MECNKDEATRAKEIAEKKFMAKDINGAKKFALKAQNLYPGLEGIPQMLATFDVYISAENKINGEADWYRILDVSPHADDDSVRKQYRKLALMLHPDKNKSIGADGAFKLISEAWSLLSDKAKREAYDQKQNARVFQKVSTTTKGSAASTGANGFYNFTKSTASNMRAYKTATTTRKGHSSAPPASSHKPKAETFWTVCHACKMHYEYLRVYLNHKLICPNCHEPFLALETGPPSNGSKSSGQWNFSHQQQNSNNQAGGKNTFNPKKNNAATSNVKSEGLNNSDSYNHSNFQWGLFSRAGGVSTTAQAATVVQQAYEKVKRQREEAQAATKREDALRRKHASKKMGGVSFTGYSNAAKRRKGMDDIGERSYGKDVTNRLDIGNGGARKVSNSETGRINGNTKPNSTWENSHPKMHNLLMEKAKVEIRKKMNELNSVSDTKSATEMEGKDNLKVNESETHDRKKPGDALDANNAPRISDANIDTESVEIMTMNVPDPDFHDFDKDRTEGSFGDNQVWAAYDDDDGMPRYYAMIHSLVCLNPFKMRISWLNSKTNSELGPLNWVGSGFSKTCGDFRIGKYEINNSLNSFSHKVRWTKGARGVICIYPRTGEVWALYRNWSPDWNELTADEVIHKYDMVEVLEDYNEEQGVTVTPIVKVAGFKTVFHSHLDPREVRRIPREEMFRFSHHVPSYLLTGQEAPNAPKGCLELDPAATPLELLQVIADVKEEEFTNNEEKGNDENVVDNLEKGNEEELVENMENL